MARTFRRKSLTKHDAKAFYRLFCEHDVCNSRNKAGELVYKWQWWYPDIESYREYVKIEISLFHRDVGISGATGYNKAPWCFRNIRNRALRKKHTQQIKFSLSRGEYDVVIDEFTHTAGWDYW